MKNQYYIEFVQNAFLPHYQIGSNPAAGARALVCHSDGDLFLYLRWKVHTVHAGRGSGLLRLPQTDAGGGGRIYTLPRFRDMGPKQAWTGNGFVISGREKGKKKKIPFSGK